MMNRRWLCLPVLLILALALAARGYSGARRLEASRLLSRAETVSLGMVARGQAPRQLLAQNLRDLRLAAELDPLEVGIPLALGSQYLLLGRPEKAAESYREALALEPRPEIYLNLGKALRLSGQEQEANQCFDRAIRLDRNMRQQVPR